MSGSEAGHGVRSVGVVAGENELSIGKPVHQHGRQAAHQFGGRLVTTTLGGVRALVPVQRDQNRQRQRPTRVRQFDQNRQNNPFATIAIDGVRVRTANRIAPPGLAINLLAAMPVDRLIADDLDRSSGNLLIFSTVAASHGCDVKIAT